MTQLKFTLRDLFWLVLMAAIVLGWSSHDHIQSQQAQTRELKLIRERDKWRERAWDAAYELEDRRGQDILNHWSLEDSRENRIF